MKKMLITFAIILLGCTVMAAQDEIYMDAKNAPKTEVLTKAQKQERKKKEKRLKAFNDSVAWNKAVKVVEDGYFVLQATRLNMGNMGRIESGLDESTNFVYQQGNEGVAQFALNNGHLGANGFGGVTCKGNISGKNISYDKKGNLHCDFNIMGMGLDVRVNITVYKDTNNAEAFIEPIMGGAWSSITMYGSLIPYKQDK